MGTSLEHFKLSSPNILIRLKRARCCALQCDAERTRVYQETYSLALSKLHLRLSDSLLLLHTLGRWPASIFSSGFWLSRLLSRLALGTTSAGFVTTVLRRIIMQNSAILQHCHHCKIRYTCTPCSGFHLG